MDVKTEVVAVEQAIQTSSPLWILAGIAALILVILVVLIVRAQKAAKTKVPLGAQPAKATPMAIWHWADDMVRRGLRALNYLSTRKDWCYEQPWVISLGEKAAGKTSIAHSLTSGYRQEVLLRERNLVLPGTEWRFYNGGVLIDVDGRYSSSEANSEDRSRWHSLMEQISSHRPERAIDSVVLTISAKTLQKVSGQQQQTLVEGLYRQLFDIQKFFSFTMPVYVIISQCDDLDGFRPFWEALDTKQRRPEMFGWSNPYHLQNNFVVDWVYQAFDDISESLQWAQTQAAARKTIQNSDQFFLFPQQFKALREPVAQLLERVFKPSGYHANFFFRGLYFSGRESVPGKDEGKLQKPIADVLFVDDVFDQKIFAETHLARPTRAGTLSRNKLIRRLQIGSIAALVLSFITLGISTVNLNREVDAVITSLKLSQAPDNVAQDGEALCASGDTVYKILTNVSQIKTGLKFYAIPASWFFGDINQQITKVVSEEAFNGVVFPSLQCHLQQKANQLVAVTMPVEPAGLTPDQRQAFYMQQLSDYLTQVDQLNGSLSDYQAITRYSDTSDATPVLDKFATLALYLYGKTVPKVIYQKQGLHRQAIAQVSYEGAVTLPKNYVQITSDHINALAARVRSVMDQQVALGDTLLQDISKNPASVTRDAQQFEQWVKWVQASWIGTTESKNPCATVANLLETTVNDLVANPLQVTSANAGERVIAGANNYTLSSFSKSLGLFSTSACYNKILSAFAKQSVAPIGNLFSYDQKQLTLKPDTVTETSGFEATFALDYMKLNPQGGFACQTPLSGWNTDQLDEASVRYQEYANFAQAQGIAGNTSAAKRPLYDRLARSQLEKVMNDLVNQAQEPMSFAQLSQAGVTVTDMVADESRDFANAKDALLLVLQIYKQMGFTKSHDAIASCARTMGLDVLQTLSTMTQSSYLYQPQINPQTDPSAGTTLYSGLNNTAKTTAYLTSQLLRAQVFAKIADPYVSFLKSTSVYTGTEPADQQNIDYWDNTVSEVNQMVKFKNDKAQVGQLNSVVETLIAPITYGDCAKQLGAYKATAYGNDLFSDRRQELVENTQLQCADHSQTEVLTQYKKLAKTYNAQMAGYYPFDLNATKDASIASVRAFFDSYALERDTLKERLSVITDKKWDSVKTFIEQLDAWADFFDKNLAATGAAQSVVLDVQFRAFAKDNDGSDQVVNWTLSNGTDNALYPNGATVLNWIYGQPLNLNLEWADESVLKPLADPNQTGLVVSGQLANFDYTGSWSLFRLIDDHVPDAAHASDPLSPDNVVTQFNVPTQNKDAAQAKQPKTVSLYLSLALKGKDPTTQKSVQLKWPGQLPDSAPVNW